MIIGNTFAETFIALVTVSGILAIIIGSYVGIRLLRQRGKQRRKDTGEDPLAFYKAGWECCVDGKPIARLTWAGIPEDLNHYFMPYDVTVLAGCEPEVKKLLYRFNHRSPEDGKISLRSLDPNIADLCDSQVLVGYLGGNRIEMKIYPPRDASNIA